LIRFGIYLVLLYLNSIVLYEDILFIVVNVNNKLMHIVKFVFLSAILVPFCDMPAEARTNDSESNVISNQDQLVHKDDFVEKNRWTTKASSLLAQSNDSSSEPSPQIAESSKSNEVAQLRQGEPTSVIQQLQEVGQRNFAPFRGAPSFTFANPSGFGADQGRKYIGVGFTPNSRNFGGNDFDDADGVLGLGIGLGNAHKSVGLELNYTLAGFGSNRDFGSGGFSGKLHRVISRGWSVAGGVNGFLNIGDDNDFEDSVFFATTKIFETREKINSAFSRVAITAGVGNGQFRTEDAIFDDDDGFNPFGSLAFRVARPVSGVIEWTGQDLAVGTSIAPFRRIPVTVNLGLRDIVGAGDGARFVLGVGAGF